MKGFSLLELLITFIVLIGLAAIAVPCYQNYKKRSYFSELIATTASYKTGVADCFEELKTLNNCNGGQHHVPKNSEKATPLVASIQVENGVITMVPVAKNGILATDVYILTPTAPKEGAELIWHSSGSAVVRGVAN